MDGLREKLRLYVITDGRVRDEIETAKLALEGGATAIQLRMKNTSTRRMVEVGKEICKIVDEYDALFIVDDRVDIALATKAHGVHVGQDDMPVDIVKEIAPELIVGVTVHNVLEARRAQEQGADYLGAGSVFPTKTKENAVYIGIENLRKIVESVSVPVVAIGGINKDNVQDVLKTGVAGVAVISAIVYAKDIFSATREMSIKIKSSVGHL